MITEKKTDKTMEENYPGRMEFLAKEYELTKAGKHVRYRFVTDFYKANNIQMQNFLRYYHRHNETKDIKSFIPRKRGPKYNTGRTIPFIEKQVLKERYSIEFKGVLTDNGSEFGGGSQNDDNQTTNPVKRLFYEMGIQHRTIKPYRPQTNGKIERFWRVTEEDFIKETVFDTKEEMEEELLSI